MRGGTVRSVDSDDPTGLHRKILQTPVIDTVHRGLRKHVLSQSSDGAKSSLSWGAIVRCEQLPGPLSLPREQEKRTQHWERNQNLDSAP